MYYHQVYILRKNSSWALVWYCADEKGVFERFYLRIFDPHQIPVYRTFSLILFVALFTVYKREMKYQFLSSLSQILSGFFLKSSLNLSFNGWTTNFSKDSTHKGTVQLVKWVRNPSMSHSQITHYNITFMNKTT